ncbi:MAG: hydantoinase/oxoprolinase family protein [Candidatus Freyarchaeota archaeon]|nr:hydantoinase/oxoprolinase family protein [Candidatus Jordarchaeia archaeon]MBS7270029.1 hydantoinase/oxoprolinase family protein [Candidatus Jordarchaeia archaeon]MBS7280722.1 hydantoinase/oxoprolinase family protein [Candidatus Jordarchaeia archaeon]
MAAARKPVIVSLDAGGTMTDTVIVDSEGNFITGKALTTPSDESICFANSVQDAASYWNMSIGEVLSQVDSTIYSGTTMINTLLTRSGIKVGLITCKGFEDMVLMERGLVWLGYSYQDRLHVATHIHNEPLVPRNMVIGVEERTDMLGMPVIPLNEKEVEKGAERLLDLGAEAVAIMFLYSHLNPTHERRAGEIVKEVAKKRDKDLLVVLSSDVAPIMREYSRLNSVLIQAYAAEPSRKQLLKVEERAKKEGYRFNLLTMLSYGGLVDVRYRRLYETLISGPIGGMLGAQYVGGLLGIRNIVSTDLGGTSFDVGIIKDGIIPMLREPDVARFRLNLPMVMMDSIGAGTGTVIKINPETKRLTLGPESAAARVGMCYDYHMPTICDCDVALGYLNPDNFLGGKIKLNKDKALEACKQIADVYERDVYETAMGIIDLVNSHMRSHIYAMLLARGYNPAEYTLMSYGGAGPLHLWGYVENIPFQNVITFPFAAVFSAFGISTADYSHRYHKSILAQVLPPSDPKAAFMNQLAQSAINSGWESLEQQALSELRAEGVDLEKVKFDHLCYVRYAGQLDDHEVVSPVKRVEKAEDLKKITDKFEEVYESIYPKAAKYPEAGYQILEVGLVARVETKKPIIPKRKLGSRKPSDEAFKGERDVFHKGNWTKFTIWDMEKLHAGNIVAGPAILEHPTTTLVVPPAYKVKFDEHEFIWYSKA